MTPNPYVDKVEYRRLIEEIGEDYCEKGHYCIFKEFLIEAHPSRRLLVQLKNCDQAKYIWSKDIGVDFGWDATLMRWITDGHAKKFAEVYKDSLSAKKIFSLVFEHPNDSKPRSTTPP